jgi:hypothetical protein
MTLPHLSTLAKLANLALHPHACAGVRAMVPAMVLCLMLLVLPSCHSQSGHSKVAHYSSAPEAQKITVNLLRLDHQVRTGGTPLSIAAAAIGIATVGNGIPLEIFTTKINPEVVKKLNLPGVRIRHISMPYQRVSVVIENLALLFPLARIREVRLISPAYGATTHMTAQGDFTIEPSGDDSHAG